MRQVICNLKCNFNKNGICYKEKIQLNKVDDFTLKCFDWENNEFETHVKKLRAKFEKVISDKIKNNPYNPDKDPAVNRLQEKLNKI